MTNPTHTALYRHFDKEGKLLYIGISLNVAARLAQHKASAPWFGDIVTVTIKRYRTRAAAATAERAAILREQPIHNRAHKRVLSARERADRRLSKWELDAANKLTALWEAAAGFCWSVASKMDDDDYPTEAQRYALATRKDERNRKRRARREAAHSQVAA